MSDCRYGISPVNYSDPDPDSTRTAAKGKKKLERPPPLKQSTRNLSLGYTEIEKKKEGARARSFLCDL